MKTNEIISKQKATPSYHQTINFWGRLLGILILLLIISVPVIVSSYFDIFPPIKNLMSGIGMVCMIYIPICAAEFLTYTPMLGYNASYLVFVTGNLTNLKIPCALMCMENVGVKPQSEEGEVIAGIAVAVSSIVTIIVVFIGMLAIVPLTPILSSETLAPAFDHILPALFGGLGAYWIFKNWKLALTPILVVIILYGVFKIPGSYRGVLIPVMGLISVIAARILYSHNKI